MSNVVVPLQAVPSQSIAVELAAQPCRIDVRQRRTGLFLDLYVNDAAIITGVICRNGTRIVREGYRGFAGDLFFNDTLGTADPTYDGLGSRFVLLYAA